MRKRISVDRKQLKAAIAACAQQKTQAAKKNLQILRRLAKPSANSVARIAAAARCSRSHVFNVLNCVASGTFAKLTRSGSFQKAALLTESQKQELDSKLGTEFKCAADVQAWHGNAGRAVVNAWCRQLGFSFRRARAARRAKAALAPDGNRRKAKLLALDNEAIDQLEARQDTERDLFRIPAGRFWKTDRSGKRLRGPNPVLRIQAVLRLRHKSISEVAAELRCSRSDVRRWRKLYLDKGIDGLCSTKKAGRPRKEKPGSLPSQETTTPLPVKRGGNEIVEHLRTFTDREGMEQMLKNYLKPLPPDCPGPVSTTFVYGVRGVGKTNIARKALADAAYFDCEDETVRQDLQSPYDILPRIEKPVVIFDEVAQLRNPEECLAAASSAGKGILVISSISTIPGSEKILGDFLVATDGVELLPLLWRNRQLMIEQIASSKPFEDALVRPGLPDLFFEPDDLTTAYQEWIRSVFERDVRRFCNCDAEQYARLIDFIMRRSGTLIELPDLSVKSGLNPGVVSACLDALKVAGVIWPVRLIDSRSGEKTKIFASDHGYVHELRSADARAENRQSHLELLWKHLVLLELRHILGQADNIYSWQSANGQSVDFVVEVQPGESVAIQCDWAGTDDMRGLKTLRRIYPHGSNVVVSPQIAAKNFSNEEFQYADCTPSDLVSFISPSSVRLPSAPLVSHRSLRG